MNEFNFEESFKRLEEILDVMNEGKVPLKDSLSLFEEADQLIKRCDKFLSSSEKRIETLIKNRDDTLQVDENNIPVKESFSPNAENVLQEDKNIPF